jgi:hypothetical protein
MAKLAVPNQATFDLPEGNFSITLARYHQQLKQTAKGSQTSIRLLFNVKVPGMEDVIPLAGRNFEAKLDSGTDLRNFLESWLGRDYFLKLSGKELNLDDLIGNPGEATLRHFQGPDFDRPLVIVEGLYPTGTLKLTDTPKTKDITVAPKIRRTTDKPEKKEVTVAPKI